MPVKKEVRFIVRALSSAPVLTSRDPHERIGFFDAKSFVLSNPHAGIKRDGGDLALRESR